MEKTVVNDMFKTFTIKNLSSTPFVHEYSGQRIVIGSKKQVTLPAAAAKDCAYHLAQQVLAEKWLPFFWQAHDDEINNILWIVVVKPKIVDEFDWDKIVVEGEYLGEDIEESTDDDSEDETSEDSDLVGIKATKKALNSKPKKSK